MSLESSPRNPFQDCETGTLDLMLSCNKTPEGTPLTEEDRENIKLVLAGRAV